MNKILKYDIENTDANTYIMTHTTNPLISTKTLRLALKKFLKVVIMILCSLLIDFKQGSMMLALIL